MPAMYELPPLPLEAVEGLEPALRIRHAITNTNYYVQVFSARRGAPASAGSRASTGKRSGAQPMRCAAAIPAVAHDLHWTRTARLASLPLTGLTRKILQRLKVMKNNSRRASRMTGRGQGLDSKAIRGRLSMRRFASRRMDSEPDDETAAQYFAAEQSAPA